MLRKTSSIAIAITVAVASLGSTSSASANSVLRASLLQGRVTSSQEELQEKTAGQFRMFCDPIPFWPWCK